MNTRTLPAWLAADLADARAEVDYLRHAWSIGDATPAEMTSAAYALSQTEWLADECWHPAESGSLNNPIAA